MLKHCKDCDHEPVCGSPHTEHTLGCDYWRKAEVRCMECKHWKRNLYVRTEYGLCSGLSFITINMHETDFCGKGEAKDDG